MTTRDEMSSREPVIIARRRWPAWATVAAAALSVTGLTWWVRDASSPETAGTVASAPAAANETSSAPERTRVTEIRGGEAEAEATVGLSRWRELRQPGRVFRDCDDCPEMVVLPAGEFRMGSRADDDEADVDERPEHEVRVGRFAMGRYEVTRGEYAAFASATGHPAGSRCRTQDDNGAWRLEDGVSWRNPGVAQDDRHPVVCVNWEDAQAYVQWLRQRTGQEYRLPSEAEWERAARAGTTTRRPWGDSSSSQCRHANGADAATKQIYERERRLAPCDDGQVRTAPVGSFEANPFGLFDMLGNVREWVEDCWRENYYFNARRDGSAWTGGEDCSTRALRGGSWSRIPRHLRSAARSELPAEIRYDNSGFRVARTLD